VAIGLNTNGQIHLDEMARQWARAQPREAMGPLVYDGPSTVQLISAADHRWSCVKRHATSSLSYCAVTAFRHRGCDGHCQFRHVDGTRSAGMKCPRRGDSTRPARIRWPRQELLVGLLGHGGLGHGARGEKRLAVDPEMDKAAGRH